MTAESGIIIAVFRIKTAILAQQKRQGEIKVRSALFKLGNHVQTVLVSAAVISRI